MCLDMLPQAGRNVFSRGVFFQLCHLRGWGWNQCQHWVESCISRLTYDSDLCCTLSSALSHPRAASPRISEELPQRTCPCQPTLTTFRACTLSSWCLCMIPGNRQPCTYSQSSFIFCSTEGSWFLQQQRRQLLTWHSHARIPSKLPTQPFLCQRAKKSLSQPGCSSKSLRLVLLVHAAVPMLPASALRGRHQLPSSGEMHKPHRPAAPAPACTLDVPVGRIHPLPLHGQHDELVGGEIKLAVLLLR